VSFPSRATRLPVRFFAVAGVFALALCLWLLSGRRTYLESLVTEAHAPDRVRYIVVLTGGTAGHALPTDSGWDRIYTAVQSHADGFSPAVVFNGGGADKISEAEVFAEAARWLGVPASVVVLDPFPGTTAEHSGDLLKIDQATLPAPIRRDTPLLVVPSRLHSRRAARCFRKTGFTKVRVVTSHEAGTAAVARSRRTSAVAAYAPNNKDYGDPVNRLRWGLNDTLMALRELAGIAVYRSRGQA
jgi:uncharacterized SAM-binding protein YcdF (DUF218 family)